jgi:hypothetical protein
MSLIENARRKIQEVKNSGSTTLSLEGLGLTTSELESLMPAIIENQQLTELNLTENSLHTLPDSISSLTNLESLDLETNDITSLPESLRDLSNLERIYLRNNDLAVFPEVLTQMERLEHADLRGNLMTDFPRNITDLGDLNIDVSGNNFEREALAFIVTTFPNGEAATNNPVEDIEPEIEQVLEAIYPDNSEEIIASVENFRLEPFDTDPENDKSGAEILTEFLSQLSETALGGQMGEEVYKPVIIDLMDIVLDTDRSDEERSNELQRMATALGDCPTPVRSFLIQKKVAQQLRNENELTLFLQSLLDREAVEARIHVAMGDKLRSAEKIEQVQTMVNSLFMEGAESYEYNQNLKITGVRPRLESKTPNEQYGFQTLTDDQATAFAKLFCEINTQHELSTNTEGQYILDPAKLKSVTAAYKATKGFITEEEQAIAAKASSYETAVSGQLQNDILVANSLEDDVKPLIDIRERKEELRVALYRTPIGQREATYQQFVQNQLAKIQEATQKYGAQEQAELAALMNPVNQNRAAPPQRRRERSESPESRRTRPRRQG